MATFGWSTLSRSVTSSAFLGESHSSSMEPWSWLCWSIQSIGSAGDCSLVNGVRSKQICFIAQTSPISHLACVLENVQLSRCLVYKTLRQLGSSQKTIRFVFDVKTFQFFFHNIKILTKNSLQSSAPFIKR